jgi:hypothetical protein
MMKKLILGAAAASMLIGASAMAKDAKPKATKAGNIADCDASAKAAIESLESAQKTLKVSSASGKAGGHFAKAQQGLSHSIAEIKKGCTYSATNAAGGTGDKGKAAPAPTGEQK